MWRRPKIDRRMAMKLAHAGRGAAHCGEHRQAAKAATVKPAPHCVMEATLPKCKISSFRLIQINAPTKSQGQSAH